MAQVEVSSAVRDLRSQADRKPVRTARSRTLRAIVIASCVGFPLLDEFEVICFNSVRTIINVMCQLYLITCHGCIVEAIIHYVWVLVLGCV